MIIRNYRIGIVLLSRFSSIRLPGKALININGKPLLSNIISRIETCFERQDIIIATSTEPSDDVIERLAIEEGVKIFRGDLDNVASRFIEAATMNNLDYAIRVTGDSLFIDPKIAVELLNYIQQDDFDLISNRTKQMYPIGQTFEIVCLKTMKGLFPYFSDPGDFEHVTQFLYTNEKTYNLKVKHHVNPAGSFRDISLAIDTPEDLRIAQQVMQSIGDNFINIGYADVYARYKSILSNATSETD